LHAFSLPYEGDSAVLGAVPRLLNSADRKVQEVLLASGEIPKHIAIIMDGNGRWANGRGMPRIAGHTEGVESVREIVEVCGQVGVQYLTLYAFSTENWNRPEEEVSLLMRLLLRSLRNETDRLLTNNVRIRTIGDIGTLPEEVRKELQEDILKTKDSTGLTLTLALSYSGRWDLMGAIRLIAQQVATGAIRPEEINEEKIASSLSTNGMPDPDLLIRTSGEFRLSNFLLWQLAYTEIFITPKYWPEFRRNDLYEAIRDYQKRERRFGLISEQIRPKGRDAGLFQRLIKSVTGP